MKILLVIIFLHVLVILRAKQSRGDDPPYFTTAFLSLLVTVFVLFMMFAMEEPIP